MGQQVGKAIQKAFTGPRASSAADASAADGAADMTAAGATDLAGAGAASGAAAAGSTGLLADLGPLAALASKGGQAPSNGKKTLAMVSPGEIYLSPDQAKAVAAGKASPKEGVKIPGKAKVKGDSKENDTVPMNLEPGGVVIKRSKVNSDSPESHMTRFVESVMARQQMGRRGKK